MRVLRSRVFVACVASANTSIGCGGAASASRFGELMNVGSVTP
jgi:hypothetical protein